MEQRTYTQTGIINGISAPNDITDDAKEVWGVLLDDLIKMGVFRDADRLLLAEISEMIAEARRQRASLQQPESHYWIYGERDISKEHLKVMEHDLDAQRTMWPLSQAYKRARAAYVQTMKLLNSYISEFGITPVARLRLGLLQLQGQGLAEAFAAQEGDDDDLGPRVIDSEAV